MSRILAGTRYLIILPVLGLRAWSGKLGKETVAEEETWEKDAGGQAAKPHDERAGTEGGG